MHHANLDYLLGECSENDSDYYEESGPMPIMASKFKEEPKKETKPIAVTAQLKKPKTAKIVARNRFEKAIPARGPNSQVRPNTKS